MSPQEKKQTLDALKTAGGATTAGGGSAPATSDTAKTDLQLTYKGQTYTDINDIMAALDQYQQDTGDVAKEETQEQGAQDGSQSAVDPMMGMGKINPQSWGN